MKKGPNHALNAGLAPKLTPIKKGVMSRRGLWYPVSGSSGVTCGKRLFRAKGRCGSGCRGVWRTLGAGRRSAAYASMCGPLLPFLREGNPPDFVRILTKSTLCNTRAAKAKENQACGQGGGFLLLPEFCEQHSAPDRHRAEIAKIAGAVPRHYRPGA